MCKNEPLILLHSSILKYLKMEMLGTYAYSWAKIKMQRAEIHVKVVFYGNTHDCISDIVEVQQKRVVNCSGKSSGINSKHRP